MEIPPPQEPGSLVSTTHALIGRLYSSLLRGRDRFTVEDASQMLDEMHPWLVTPLTAIDSLVMQRFGGPETYVAEDPEIQEFVRTDLANMKGSLALSLQEAVTVAIIAGWSCTEHSVQIKDGSPSYLGTLALTVIPPKHHKFSSDMESVIYGPMATEIPLSRIIHLVNQPSISKLQDRGLYGLSQLRFAKAAIDSWKIFLSAFVTAGQRSAEGVGILYTDTSEPHLVSVVDRYGREIEISLSEYAEQQLAGMKNGEIMQLVKDVQDFSYENASVNNQIFEYAMDYFPRMVFMAMCVPETLMQVSSTGGGTGDSNLSKTHNKMLEAYIDRLISGYLEALVEGPIRNLINWRFGPQGDYGRFVKPEEADPHALEKADLILKALSLPTIPATSSVRPALLNQFLQYVGVDHQIPEIDEQGALDAAARRPTLY